MTKYIKNSIPSVVSVTSVISAHHTILTGRCPLGEKHDFPELFFVERGEYSVYVDSTQIKEAENFFVKSL